MKNLVRSLHARPLPIAPLVLLGLLAGCAPSRIEPGTPLTRTGDEIVVCGQLFHTGTPVVLWLDPGGYDAYRVENHFEYEKRPAMSPASSPTSAPTTSAAAKPDPPAEARYGSWRKHVPAE